jgi:hypothetical protein
MPDSSDVNAVKSDDISQTSVRNDDILKPSVRNDEVLQTTLPSVFLFDSGLDGRAEIASYNKFMDEIFSRF